MNNVDNCKVIGVDMWISIVSDVLIALGVYKMAIVRKKSQ